MRFSLIAITASLISLVTATGTAMVYNNCTSPIYVYSVGSSTSDEFKLLEDQKYVEEYKHDPTTGGIAIKIVTVQGGLYTSGVAQTILAYSKDEGDTAVSKVWYDLSDAYGDPFKGKKLAVTVNDASCPGISWPTGVSPGGSQTKSCSSNANIRLTLCSP